MENKFNIKFYNGIKNILKIPFKLAFNPVVTGIENLPSKPYILVGNHISIFDIPFLVTSIPDEIHFMAKKELFDKKIIKDILLKVGAFPIDREKLDIKAIRTAFKLLEDNNVIGIFPEGTRNKTESVILPFKSGASMIGIKTNSPIVPFGIVGEYRLGSSICLNIGEPIEMKEIDKENQTEYLEEKVKKLIRSDN